MNKLYFLLDAAQTAASPSSPAGQQQGSPMIMNILFIGLIVIVFYFFMIRPQMKKQKDQNNFLNEIGKGSKVVTIGGIVGKVTDVREKTFIIDVEGGGKLQVLKSAISLDYSRNLNAEKSGDDKDKKD